MSVVRYLVYSSWQKICMWSLHVVLCAVNITRENHVILECAFINQAVLTSTRLLCCFVFACFIPCLFFFFFFGCVTVSPPTVNVGLTGNILGAVLAYIISCRNVTVLSNVMQCYLRPIPFMDTQRFIAYQ